MILGQSQSHVFSPGDLFDIVQWTIFEPRLQKKKTFKKSFTMTGKRPAGIPASTPPKKCCHSIILDVIERGERAVDIGRTLGLPLTTVRAIVKNSDKLKLKASGQNVTPGSSLRITRSREGILEIMERMLMVWMEDQCQRNVPMSLALIQGKARSLCRVR